MDVVLSRVYGDVCTRSLFTPSTHVDEAFEGVSQTPYHRATMELHELLVGRRQRRHYNSLYGEGRAHLCPSDEFPGLGTCRRRWGLGFSAPLLRVRASALLRVRAAGDIAPFHMPFCRAYSCFVMYLLPYFCFKCRA